MIKFLKLCLNSFLFNLSLNLNVLRNHLILNNSQSFNSLICFSSHFIFFDQNFFFKISNFSQSFNCIHLHLFSQLKQSNLTFSVHLHHELIFNLHLLFLRLLQNIDSVISNLVLSSPFCISKVFFLLSFLLKDIELGSNVLWSILLVFKIHELYHSLVCMLLKKFNLFFFK